MGKGYQYDILRELLKQPNKALEEWFTNDLKSLMIRVHTDVVIDWYNPPLPTMMRKPLYGHITKFEDLKLDKKDLQKLYILDVDLGKEDGEIQSLIKDYYWLDRYDKENKEDKAEPADSGE